MMKITFFTPHIDISGGVKIILGYADRLTKRGHEVVVICPQPALAREKIKGIPVFYPKRVVMNFLGYKPDWIECAANITYVPSYEERYIPDADIIVATAWQTAPFVNFYSQIKGSKFYLIQGYESEIFGSEEEVHKTYSYPLKKIVVANWLKVLLKEKFNKESELIHNPIDLHTFYPTGKIGSPEIKRICMLYHTSIWKGVTDGFKAFELAKQEYPSIQLVMFGIRKGKVNTDCEYHYRPLGGELREIYNSCDIFLCPSWREGFHLPPAEAMACKCALITTDIGGTRDYAIHEKTALLSAPKDPEALAENLKRLLGNEALLKRIAQNGYEHIKQFTWDRAVIKIETLFLEELAKKKARNRIK